MDPTSLKDVIKEDGVSDILPMKAKGKFAQALIAERSGNDELAEVRLNEAIELEDTSS
jgi:hypothetical protein